jgi:hypothetical protein
MITHVAIRQKDGRIFSLPKPYRHHHVLKMMRNLEEDCTELMGENQGFLNDKGKYLTRMVGAVYAIEREQIEELATPPFLFSEDLW